MSWRKILKFFRKKRRSYTDAEIYPDEIFLDARNLPQFDVHQFEGRLEKPIPKTVLIILGGIFILTGFIYISQIWVLQVKKGEAFAEQSENNRLRHTSLFSNRGIIYDRNGVELASNTINKEEPDFAQRVYAPIKGIAHVVGYLKYPTKDNAGFYYKTEYDGKDGAEKIFNAELSGENGTRIVETNALGEIKSESVVEPPKDGENIVLSIDSGIQSQMYKAIENASEKYGFRGGAGVMMDIYTGEIIALTSFPEYDSNIMTDGSNREVISGYQNANNPFLNRVVSGVYTPGSIVKPYMALAALSENIIDPNKQILSTGSISIQNPYNPEQKTTFRDWRAQGWVDMREALAVSSDVYFYAIGGGYEDQKGLGITNIEKYVRMMGFGEKTNINMLGEVEGTIPSPKWKAEVFGGDDWRLGDTYHTSIGQYGFQLTPIQAVRGVASIANNGTLLQPTILKRKPNEPIKNSRVVPIKDEYYKIVKEGMRQAVFTVTAGALNLPYISVAAKTGTAELGTAKLFVNSCVTGFFPYENPKYAFAIIMEKGARTNQLGATYVMRDVLDWMKIYTPEYLGN
ncbi:MAG: penicillin-binding transpeptidase domain-containing protein [Candidatus Paceibacterota bacterium]